MYKNCTQKPGMLTGHIHKFLFVMKLTTLVIIAAIVQVSAASYAQKVTLKKKEVTLEAIFGEMHRQTGYDFFFDRNLLGKAKPITVDLKNVSLDDALNACLAKQPFTYVIENKTVVIKEMPPLSVPEAKAVLVPVSI